MLLELFEYFSLYKGGGTSVEYAKCLACRTNKTDKNVDRVKELVLKHRRITICEVVNILGIPFWDSSEGNDLKSGLWGSVSPSWQHTCSVCLACA
jgi:hypothetical protein